MAATPHPCSVLHPFLLPRSAPEAEKVQAKFGETGCQDRPEPVSLPGFAS